MDRPVILHVDRDRDGGSFSARHVRAVQDGEVIFSMIASFHVSEESGAFEAEGPLDVAPPETLRPRSGPFPGSGRAGAACKPGLFMIHPLRHRLMNSPD